MASNANTKTITSSSFDSFAKQTFIYPEQYVKTKFIESSNELHIIGSGSNVVAQFRPDGIKFMLRGDLYINATTLRTNGVVQLNRDHKLQPDTRPFIGEKIQTGEYHFLFHFPYDLTHAMEFVERLHRLFILEICTMRIFEHVRKTVKDNMTVIGDDIGEDYCEITSKEPKKTKKTAISIANDTTSGFCLVYIAGFENRITQMNEHGLPDGIRNDHLFNREFEGYITEDDQFSMQFDLPREYDRLIHMLDAAMDNDDEAGP
jgi:hypothetical protein